MKKEVFKRELGLWSASALVAGSMIGSGIFFFVSSVVQRLHSPGYVVLAWFVGACIAFCGALCLSELASAYPKTGGIYVFLNQSFGSLVAFLYSWTKFLIMRIGSFGIPALLFASFFCSLFHVSKELTESVKVPIAIGFIVVLTLINIAGVKFGGIIQNIFTFAKVLCLLAIVLLAIALFSNYIQPHPIHLKPVVLNPPQTNFFILFCSALIPIMWTFGGWDESPFVAEEVKNPEKNLPFSILGGFILVALLYILVNAAYLTILTPAEMAGSGQETATFAMQRTLGSSAKIVLSLFLMISTFGAANGMALTGARIAYATGKNQKVFAWFSHVNPKTKTPVRSLIVQAILSCLCIIFMKDPFDLLLYTGFAYWIFSGLIGVSLIVQRIKDPERERPFKVRGYYIIPSLFILASLGMLASIIIEKPKHVLITLAIFGVGILVFYSQKMYASKEI